MSAVKIEPTLPERPGAGGPVARVRRRTVVAWASWDWGSSAFNAVITSFVFGPYLVRGVVGEARPLGLSGDTWLGISNACAGVLIALLASVTGQRADAGGHRRRSLAVWTGLVVIVMLALFSVRNEPSYLWIGLVLMATGAIFIEFAGVSYNAMLPQVSTPATLGRVSGFGWAMGYAGGIFLLLILYVGFIAPDVGWFGVTSEGGLRFRMVAVFSAVWFALFALPVLFAVPEVPAGPKTRRVGLIASYRVLFRDVRALWRADRNSVYFLIASALYRDGLAAVFSFGAILAVSVYGMAQSTVLIFGIVANLVAAAGALVLGRVEDVIGPKRVITLSLVGLIVTATILLFAEGTTMFWIFGLILCLWVGPAQASSRAFLARIAPRGREGQMFGLYATTGRAVSFLAPALFALFSGLFTDRIGIVGIALVLLGGLLALLKVRSPHRIQSPPPS
ncbi:UMF1 family MFS transporter [Friedmanniella endophytica]|uniref:UMF1 family MFS transporter n=1 Tax=Microlunatus kandeliicorticis TaxID=1759536 RepID=A0A7W3ITQ2_9ACTN|nr:MFS transporter [Microlunatus kandeliicorticis]MBA8794995.1 UMF1 family MFS transporter [Microlunatus kandeliicorticis]